MIIQYKDDCFLDTHGSIIALKVINQEDHEYRFCVGGKILYSYPFETKEEARSWINWYLIDGGKPLSKDKILSILKKKKTSPLPLDLSSDSDLDYL
jgi:hypothetical protein